MYLPFTMLCLDCSPIVEVYQKYSSKIVDSVSSAMKFSNDLQAVNLVSKLVKEKVNTTSGIPCYEGTTLLLNDFQKLLEISEVPKKVDILSTFCDVFLDQETPSLTSVVKELQKELQPTILCHPQPLQY